MNHVTRIRDLVRDGRISPEQGARLLELRWLIAWRSKPWWRRVMLIVAHALDWPVP